jgi:hypothetical protein
MDMEESFAIRRIDRDFAPPVGRMTIDEHGKLKLLDADPAYTEILRDIIASVNEQPAIHVKRSIAGDDVDGITFVDVARDDDDIVRAIVEHFEQKYDLRVESAIGA